MEEDFDTSQMTVDEQVAILMEELPLPVQNFLRSPDRDRISLELTRRYGLHADTAAVFERAYIFMLLGVYTPDEFVEEMREGGIDEATIKNLAADVNEMVFKRLREEERQGSVAPRPSAPPAAPVMQIGERPAPPAPPPLPPSPVVQPPAPVMEAAPVVTMAPPPPPPAPIYSAPAPVAAADPGPYIRTMATDMQLASQGPAPATPPQPPQAVPPPAPPVYEAPIPPQVSPPTAPPPPPLPTPTFVATAPVRLTPVDRGHDNAPITKEFGTDPYREPIE